MRIPPDDEQTSVVPEPPNLRIVNVERDTAALDAFEEENQSDILLHDLEQTSRDGSVDGGVLDGADITKFEVSGHAQGLDPETLRAVFELTGDIRFRPDRHETPAARSLPVDSAARTQSSDPGRSAFADASATASSSRRGARTDARHDVGAGIGAHRAAPQSVPVVFASDDGSSSSLLRAVTGVAALVVIGIVIAIGSGYLPLTAPPSVASPAAPVAPPDVIATRRLPVAPLAPADLTPPVPPSIGARPPVAALPTVAAPPAVPAPSAAAAVSTPTGNKPLIIPPPAREPYLGVNRPSSDVPTRISPPAPPETPAPPATTQISPPPTTVASAQPSVQVASAPPEPPRPTAVSPQGLAPAGAAPPAVRPPEAAPSPTAGAPPLTGVQRDEVEIRRLLDDYRHSYSQLDVAGAARLWPGLDVPSLSRAFGTIARQDVQFQECTLEVTGQRAAARCFGSLQYVARVGNTSPQSRALSWTFILDHSSGRWLISRVTAR